MSTCFGEINANYFLVANLADFLVDSPSTSLEGDNGGGTVLAAATVVSSSSSLSFVPRFLNFAKQNSH